ncbi:alpha/beta fold hydrolase [Pelagibacterium lacus]|uniref:Alpha/beta fold hydrolase n=1 Tax=Pelagibacterium lacus TaxID=2282655 RepID=A0A369WAF9_9HYPH|nr:alpha/beta fold hydrolase [Pelagibacterium lacus]RDE09051.1 alpha/beta fold hydrolase [Pelagibacterium lacus]
MQIETTSGLRLHYETRGAGPVIVLLHPVGLRGAFWKPVVERLSDRFRLVYPDLRGHGGSDVPTTDFTLSDMARDVIDLIGAVGEPPAVVCGCSLGGMLAQSIALAAPELVGGLVIAGAGFTRDAAGRKAVLARAEAARRGMPDVLETTLDRWFTDEVERADPMMVGMVRAWLLEDDPVVHARCWQAMAGLDHADRLASIGAPTLVVAATADQSVPVATLKDLASRIPGARYGEIEGAGHLAPLERPKDFAAILGDFALEIA